jgi:hypothetical protein
MEKSRVWLIIGLIIIVTALILRIANSRDHWVCEGGQWQSRGVSADSLAE